MRIRLSVLFISTVALFLFPFMLPSTNALNVNSPLFAPCQPTRPPTRTPLVPSKTPAIPWTITPLPTACETMTPTLSHDQIVGTRSVIASATASVVHLTQTQQSVYRTTTAISNAATHTKAAFDAQGTQTQAAINRTGTAAILNITQTALSNGRTMTTIANQATQTKVALDRQATQTQIAAERQAQLASIAATQTAQAQQQLVSQQPVAPACPNLRYTCSQLTCAQAYACLAAGNGRLDGDHDGKPCENQCGH